MSVSHRYRNFGETKPTGVASESSDVSASEDEKLQAFESGYQAGWDDAIKAKNDEKEKLREELTRNLLQASFTHQEALSTMTASMKPALQQIVEKLLPALVTQSLAAHICEQIEELITGHTSQTVEIVVSQNSVQTVEDLIADRLPCSLIIVGSDSVTEGQAHLRLGAHEREIDLDTTMGQISEALNAFFHEVTREQVDE